MPGRLFLTRPMAEVEAWIGVPGAPGQPARANIQPGQEVIALTSGGWSAMRWGVIPVGRVNARGRPVMETIINARSETVFDKSAFAGVSRCVLIVDGWYEWTGEKRRKTAWRIADTGGALLVFAAIWDVWTAPGGRELRQLATVTCAPNADVARVHHRMGVLLERTDVAAWMGPDEAAARALCRPWPEGRLAIDEAKDVDWAGA